MNKLLILTSFLFIFSMKINAYEYIIQDTNSTYVLKFFTDKNGELQFLRKVTNEDNPPINISLDSYITLSRVKFHYDLSLGVISSEQFDNYYKNDLNFLNDLYTSDFYKQVILNYFYNNERFSYANHISYENYELLYNSDGLAVESIVNGVWRGLYGIAENSGYLYDKNGNLAYINGVEPSFFEKITNRLLGKYKNTLQSIFIKKIWYSLLVFIFAVVILRTVIRMAFKAFLIRFYDNKIQRLEQRREKIENA